MSFDIRPVILAGAAIALIISFKLEILDFETTIIAYFILIIFAFNAVIVLLIQIEGNTDE